MLDERGAVIPGLYCAGWIKRGPTGVIGTNKKDATETVDLLLEDARRGLLPSAWTGSVDELLAERGVDVVLYAGWGAIDAVERAAGERKDARASSSAPGTSSSRSALSLRARRAFDPRPRRCCRRAKTSGGVRRDRGLDPRALELLGRAGRIRHDDGGVPGPLAETCSKAVGGVHVVSVNRVDADPLDCGERRGGRHPHEPGR